MRSWGTARTRTLAATLAALALSAVPAHAATAGAHATVTACKTDGLTVVGALKMSGRKLRGATLQLRFSAVPLFGLPQQGDWRTIGKKTKGSGQQTFSGLAADEWFGVMSWRFKKGARTVASGDERSQPGRVGGVRGAAACTLAEGLKPIDRTPPTVYVLPADSVWHRGPAQVGVYARDDFSGVRSVTYSVDGGPATAIQNNTAFTLASEGAHSVHVAATDVAGNTGTSDVVVRVDTAPPSKPALQSPPSVTQYTTPTFKWTASTDSGSGIKGYLLVIKRAADDSVVSSSPYGPGTTSAQSPQALDDGATYTATVVAYDNTDVPWTTESNQLTFKVDTHLDVTGFAPASGTVLAFALKQGPIKISLDRPADPNSVSTSSVQLQRDSASGSTVDYGVSCASPCSTINVTPNGDLPEGRYTLTVNPGGIQHPLASEEQIAFPTTTAHYAVPDPNNESSTLSTSGNCVIPASKAITIRTTAANETGLVSFSWSISAGAGNVKLVEASTTLYDSGNLNAPGGGPITQSFSLGAAGTHALTLNYCVASGNSTLNLAGVWVSRAP